MSVVLAKQKLSLIRPNIKHIISSMSIGCSYPSLLFHLAWLGRVFSNIVMLFFFRESVIGACYVKGQSAFKVPRNNQQTAFYCHTFLCLEISPQKSAATQSWQFRSAGTNIFYPILSRSREEKFHFWTTKWHWHCVLDDSLPWQSKMIDLCVVRLVNGSRRHDRQMIRGWNKKSSLVLFRLVSKKKLMKKSNIQSRNVCLSTDDERDSATINWRSPADPHSLISIEHNINQLILHSRCDLGRFRFYAVFGDEDDPRGSFLCSFRKENLAPSPIAKVIISIWYHRSALSAQHEAEIPNQ